MARKSAEEAKIYNAKYWKEHKDTIKKKRSQRREETKAYMTKWRQTNRERYNQYMRQWRAKKRAEAQANIDEMT